MAEFLGHVQLFLVWVLSTIVVRAILSRKQSKARRPPSPLALPIIGHLHLLSPLPHRAFHKLSIRYGPIMHLFLGSVPCVVASSAEASKEFLKTREASFSNRPAQTVAVECLTYGLQDFVFAPYGPYWKFMKKLCMSELLGGRMLDQLLSVRQQETMRFLRVLYEKGKIGEAVDVGRELMTLSNNVISKMTTRRTSSENENEAEEVRKLVIDTAELVGKFNISDFIWFCKKLDLQEFNKRLVDIRDRFDNMLDRIIKEHAEERSKSREMGGEQIRDILDVLLDIYEDESSGIKLTKENIKAFIMNIFAAGTDTSAVNMEWAMAELINHPHVMEKARREIDDVIGKSRIVQESDIVKLPYLQAIVKETLRIHPAAPLIFRESSKAAVVCGYEIPAKTRLFINVWAIDRDPNHWENPHEFRPERFIISEEGNGQGQLDVRGQHFQLIPFGSGRRVCPGASLALQIVHTNLAAMIQCFQWKVEGGNGTTTVVDMEEKSGITLPRAHPLISVPVPCLDSFPSF